MIRVVLAILVLVVAAGCSADLADEPDPTRTARPRATPRPTPNTAWIPSGFEQVADGVAFKRIEGECTSWPCVAYEVATRDGCPNGLYVEANVLNSGGTIVGYTNDVVQRMGASDRAKIVLDILEDDGERTRVSEINCR